MRFSWLLHHCLFFLSAFSLQLLDDSLFSLLKQRISIWLIVYSYKLSGCKQWRDVWYVYVLVCVRVCECVCFCVGVYFCVCVYVHMFVSGGLLVYVCICCVHVCVLCLSLCVYFVCVNTVWVCVTGWLYLAAPLPLPPVCWCPCSASTYMLYLVLYYLKCSSMQKIS